MTDAAMKKFDWAAFSARNLARCESPHGFNHPLKSWSFEDWLTAVLGELGEAANIKKKLNRVRDGIPGNEMSEDALRAAYADELADTFIYLDLTMQLFWLSPAEGWAKRPAPDYPQYQHLNGGYLLLAAEWIGYASQWNSRDDEGRDCIRLALCHAVTCIWSEASAAGIDLGAAVLSKFARTSAKIGYAEPEGGAA